MQLVAAVHELRDKRAFQLHFVNGALENNGEQTVVAVKDLKLSIQRVHQLGFQENEFTRQVTWVSTSSQC